MIDRGRHDILGVLIDAVDYDCAVDRVLEAARARRPFAVSALAVHGVMTGVQDRSHALRLRQLDLVVPDGQPVRWALKWLHGVGLPDRVYGPNLTLRVCEAAAKEGLSVYFYGSRQVVLDALAQRLHERIPGLRIAGMEPSQFRTLSEAEAAGVVGRIRDSGAQVVFVGLGCPRQEVWAYENVGPLSLPVLAVGAAFDFHAGLLPQAPRWMQNLGLEWLFRLRQEPRRLWRRYALLNPWYLALVLRQKCGGKPPEFSATPPPARIGYG